MLYSTKAESKVAGPRTVWIWFFLSISSLSILGLAYLAIWPGDYPQESELVQVGGSLKTSRVKDDFSNSSAGASLPVFTSVYWVFKDDEREYRYPWQHSQYYNARERTFYNIYIWVKKTDFDNYDGTPIKIWAFEEDNIHKPADEQTVVSYKENTALLDKSTNKILSMANWFGGGTVLFALIGIHAMRWNRRNYPDRH